MVYSVCYLGFVYSLFTLVAVTTRLVLSTDSHLQVFIHTVGTPLGHLVTVGLVYSGVLIAVRRFALPLGTYLVRPSETMSTALEKNQNTQYLVFKVLFLVRA